MACCELKHTRISSPLTSDVVHFPIPKRRFQTENMSRPIAIVLGDLMYIDVNPHASNKRAIPNNEN